MVHRLLSAALGLEPLPESAKEEESLRLVTDNLNTRHRCVFKGARMSANLHLVCDLASCFGRMLSAAQERTADWEATGLLAQKSGLLQAGAKP